jgi:hypothetical protein
MCHAADFTPAAGKKIDMPDYRAGKPYSLHGAAADLGGILSGDDKVLEAINGCLGAPSRLNVGKVSSSAPFIPDLMAYVKSL